MQIADAQREVRTVFQGGFAGFIVSGVLWLVCAAIATWATPGRAMVALIVGGMLIFPSTMLLLKLMGRRVSLSHENPMGQLATQVAFTIPLAYPVIGGAVLHNPNWFFPAFMVIVGAHYLPFVFLYGMKMFAVLAGLLVVGGWYVGTTWPHDFAIGGWITGVLFILFAAPARMIAARQDRVSA